jgi:hypothetical protein
MGRSELAPRGGGGLTTTSRGQVPVARSTDDIIDILARESDVPKKSLRRMPKKALLAMAAAAGIAYVGSKLLGGDEVEAAGEADDILPPRPESSENLAPEEEKAWNQRMTEFIYGDEPLQTEAGSLERFGEMIGRVTGLGPREGVIGRGAEAVGEPLGQIAEGIYGPAPEPDITEGGTMQSGGPEYFDQPIDATAPPPDYQEQVASVLERAGAGDFGSPDDPLTLTGTGVVPEGSINDPAWRQREDAMTMARAHRSKASQITDFLSSKGSSVDPGTYKSLSDEVKRLGDLAGMIDKQQHERDQFAEDRLLESKKIFGDYQSALVKAEAQNDEESRRAMELERREFQKHLWSLEEDIGEAVDNGSSKKRIEELARRLAQGQALLQGVTSEEEKEAMEYIEVQKWLGM